MTINKMIVTQEKTKLYETMTDTTKNIIASHGICNWMFVPSNLDRNFNLNAVTIKKEIAEVTAAPVNLK